MCGVRVEEAYSWPDCEAHYDLNTQNNDFYSWVWTSLYDPHGPVHVWLGGVLDCDKTYSKLRQLVGKEITAKLAYYAFVHRKNLFRSGFFSCEGQAGVETKPGEVSCVGTWGDLAQKLLENLFLHASRLTKFSSVREAQVILGGASALTFNILRFVFVYFSFQLFLSGQCGCLGYNLESGDDYLTLRDQIVFLTSYISDFPADVQREVVATICNGVVNDGDHLQVSFPLTPDCLEDESCRSLELR